MRKVLGLAAVLLAAFAASAQAQAQLGHRVARTTAPSTFVNINVNITDGKLTMSPRTAPQGTDARFIIRDNGKKPHGFQLGDKKPGTGFQSGFKTLVKPGQEKVLILFLAYAGAKVPYFGSLPSDRHNKAMQGTFTVGPCSPSAVGTDACDG